MKKYVKRKRRRKHNVPNIFPPGIHYRQFFFEEEAFFGLGDWKKQGVHFPQGTPNKLYSVAHVRQMLKDGAAYFRIPEDKSLTSEKWEKEYSPVAVLTQAWIKLWPVAMGEIKVVVERRGKCPYVVWETEEGHRKIAEWLDGTVGAEVPRDSLEKDKRLLGKVTAYAGSQEKAWSSFKEFWEKLKT